LMVSAYQNKDGKLVMVALNYSKSDKSITLNVSDRNNVLFTPYITSDLPADNLRALTPVLSNSTYTIPARSIVTFVEGGVVSAISDTFNKDEIQWHVVDGSVIIRNAENTNVTIFDSIGRMTTSRKSISNEETFNLSSRFNIVCIEKNGVITDRFKVIKSN